MIYYNYTKGEMEWEVPLGEIASNHIEKLGRFQLDKDEVVLAPSK